jgi:hypothetical protein
MNLNINKITENKVVSEEGKKIGGGGGRRFSKEQI